VHEPGAVHVQRVDGCPPGAGPAHDPSKIFTPAKVLVPALSAWIEQSHPAVRSLIPAADLGALRVVANGTGVAEVARFSFPAEGPRDNVVDFKRRWAQLLL
jgi:hypothetical protein